MFSLFFLIQGLGITTTVVTTSTTTTPPPTVPTTTPKPIVSQQKCLGSSNYCPGQYGALKAVCKAGYCFCTGKDYDYTTCLRKLFDTKKLCHIKKMKGDSLVRRYKLLSPAGKSMESASLKTCTVS